MIATIASSVMHMYVYTFIYLYIAVILSRVTYINIGLHMSRVTYINIGLSHVLLTHWNRSKEFNQHSQVQLLRVGIYMEHKEEEAGWIRSVI